MKANRASAPPPLRLAVDGDVATNRADASWLPLVRAADPAAVREAYRRSRRAVDATLRQVLGRDTDRDDLAQIVLERVFRSFFDGSFGARCSLESWASAIAARAAVDHLRRRRVERRVFAPAVDDDGLHPDESAPPDARADTQRMLARLRDALAELPPEQAEAVLLCEVLGHSHQEAATLVGVSSAALQSRAFRGKERLLALLQGKVS